MEEPETATGALTKTDPRSSAQGLPFAEDKMSKGDVISHHILSRCGQTRKQTAITFCEYSLPSAADERDLKAAPPC